MKILDWNVETFDLDWNFFDFEDCLIVLTEKDDVVDPILGIDFEEEYFQEKFMLD
jgi:hypothetical protein